MKRSSEAIMKKKVFWFRILGLLLLLSSWGAENFWKADAVQKLNRVEFVTVNSGIVSNSSNLEYLKYIVQNRQNPKLLALSYRTHLEGVIATCMILKQSGAVLPDDILVRAQSLLGEINEAYIEGVSLEPKDVKRNIKHEIVELEREEQKYFVSFLVASRKWLKFASAVFVSMYILGSFLIIISTFEEKR